MFVILDENKEKTRKTKKNRGNKNQLGTKPMGFRVMSVMTTSIRLREYLVVLNLCKAFARLGLNFIHSKFKKNEAFAR